MPHSMLDAAKKITPIIKDNLDRIDSDCQLPPELAKAMNDEGLFRLYVPVSYTHLTLPTILLV